MLWKDHPHHTTIFGETVKGLMTAQGLSTQAFTHRLRACGLQVNKQTIRGWKNGKIPRNWQTALPIIGSVLGCHPAGLVVGLTSLPTDTMICPYTSVAVALNKALVGMKNREVVVALRSLGWWGVAQQNIYGWRNGATPPLEMLIDLAIVAEWPITHLLPFRAYEPRRPRPSNRQLDEGDTDPQVEGTEEQVGVKEG
jgi:hypothetical protein